MKWDAEHSITEADAILASNNNVLKSIRIVKNKNKEEYYILMNLSWRTEELFLSTSRLKDKPRGFKDVGRLIRYIKDKYKNIERLVLILKD